MTRSICLEVKGSFSLNFGDRYYMHRQAHIRGLGEKEAIAVSTKKDLVCPLCQGTEFEKQEGKMDSKWGITAHKITMMICKNCRFIMSFSKGRTIFDFD